MERWGRENSKFKSTPPPYNEARRKLLQESLPPVNVRDEGFPRPSLLGVGLAGGKAPYLQRIPSGRQNENGTAFLYRAGAVAKFPVVSRIGNRWFRLLPVPPVKAGPQPFTWNC